MRCFLWLVLLLLIDNSIQRCSHPQVCYRWLWRWYCTPPQAEDGALVTEGCIQSVCKSGVWRSSLIYSMCCYDGQAFIVGTTISSSMSEDGCGKASIVCVEESPGNAKLELRMRNYCKDFATRQQLEDIKDMLLDYRKPGSGSVCKEYEMDTKDKIEGKKFTNYILFSKILCIKYWWRVYCSYQSSLDWPRQAGCRGRVRSSQLARPQTRGL